MLTTEVVENIINCRLPEEELRAQLTSLHPDRITVNDVRRFVSVIQSTVVPDVPRIVDSDLIDCSGTGGSGRARYNTSTTVAFVLAAAGLRVAKFGNRAFGSSSGSFDFLEALGIPLAVPVSKIGEIIDECGLVFLFAPQFYPGLRQLAPLRRAIGTPTILNAIGPLLNPLAPALRVTGVSSANVQRVIARFVAETGSVKRALIVRSESGLDELEPNEANTVFSVGMDTSPSATSLIVPANNAVERPSGALKLTPEDNLQIFHELLDGNAADYFVELVCMNAAAGLQVGGKVESLEEGRALAARLIRSGAVRERVEAARSSYAKFA